jgi:putative FmdB family regulatory protein
MPTYEYQCDGCGARFDREQAMSDPPVETCPSCGAPVRRLVSGGSGFLLKGGGRGRDDGACGFETTGRTCCGRDQRCDTPGCGEHE